VISDTLGVSGRRMIEAMIAGVRNPHQLAALAHRGIKASPKELYDALHGRLTDHHRFLLQLYLTHWDVVDATIQRVDREVDGRIEHMDPAEKDGQGPFAR
jgi:transposase